MILKAILKIIPLVPANYVAVVSWLWLLMFADDIVLLADLEKGRRVYIMSKNNSCNLGKIYVAIYAPEAGVPQPDYNVCMHHLVVRRTQTHVHNK